MYNSKLYTLLSVGLNDFVRQSRAVRAHNTHTVSIRNQKENAQLFDPVYKMDGGSHKML